MPAVAQGDRAIVRDGIGLGAAVGIFGLSFGALAIGAGLSTAQTCVLSLAMFTGGSQLAYVGVLRAGGGVGSAAASALLLGSRNALYGVTLGPLLRLPRLVRPAAAHWVIDETTAMATGAAAAPVATGAAAASVATGAAAAAGPPAAGAVPGSPHRPRLAFTVTGAAVFTCWNLATLAGALVGRSVADPGVLGLDAVGPAAFLALLWPRLRGPGAGPARRVAAVGAVLALIGSIVLPAGLAIPVAALAVLVGGVRR
jgi:predicted branched-subunit amino acid permease